MSGPCAALLLEASGAPGVIQNIGAGSAGAGSASFGLTNAGALTINGVGSGSWVLPASVGIAAGYEVKVDVTSGAFTGGDVTGTWLALSASRSWSRVGTGTVNYNV